MSTRSFGQFFRTRYPVGLQPLIDLQKGRCAYCDRSFAPPHSGSDRIATKEHVWPRWTGRGNVHNAVAACLRCNRRKDGRLPTGCELLALAAVNAKRPTGATGAPPSKPKPKG